MSVWGRFKAFILRDVQDGNELKKTSVLIRVYSIIMFLYCVWQLVLHLYVGRYAILPLVSIGILGYFVAFVLTYKAHTRFARNILIYFTLIWMTVSIFRLGWNCGFENFCFVVLVFVFVTGYAPLFAKIVGAILIAALRISLFFYTQMHVSSFAIPRWQMQHFQVINTVVVYLLLILMVALFSLDSLKSEAKLVTYNKKMKEMADMDPLTGLSNRRGMEEMIQGQLKNTAENQGFINFAIGDIDFFKKVNDTYGHAAGDDLLKQLGVLFRTYMHGKGWVARWGGEEFLFMFLGENGDQTRIELDELRMMIERTEFHFGSQTLHVTMTFGMEEHSMGESYEKTISAADKKLYYGKENGRNQVVF